MNQRRINFEGSLKIPVDKWRAANPKQPRFAATRRAVERSVTDYFKDLNFFIDFCLGRWIVWLELHRNKRGAKRPGP
jgi:hypothetical protein